MKLDKLLPYHTELNPKVWQNNHLRSDIREKLLEIAEVFKSFIDVPHLEVFDVILTGSMANYNWTNKSDFDLHLMVDYDQTDGDLAEKFFKAKKELWNNQHDITILGYDVELYAQDVKEHHISSGTYSLERDEWIVKPKYEKPDVNSLAVKIKFNSMVHLIERAMTGADIVEVEQARDKIRKMRQAGLQAKGEFSTENLVFKLLRNEGYLDRLWEYSNDLIDRNLSISDEPKEDAAGVGIITKQNTTKDVNTRTLRKMMKGYKLI